MAVPKLCLLGGLPEALPGLEGIPLGILTAHAHPIQAGGSGLSSHATFTATGDQDWADSSQDQQAGFPGVGWVSRLPPGQLRCG